MLVLHPKPPLVDWAGCGLLVARCAGCSHACVAKYFAGKKCVVCVWQFGALLVWWVGNQLLMHACGAIMGTRAAVLAFVKGLLQGQWLR